MATIVRKLTQLVAMALPLLHNQMRLDILKSVSGGIVHADASAAITTAAASTDPTSFALVNACQASYNLHCASTCHATTGVGAHMAADATNVDATAVATDLTTGYALANALKAAINAHFALTTSHPIADAAVVTATDATTSGTLITLANDIKAKLNAHYARAMTNQALSVVAA